MKISTRSFILICCLLFITTFTSAQTWTKAIDFGTSPANELGTAVCSDTRGNFYIGGRFGQTIDFDPGAGMADLTATGSTTNVNSFLTKYDRNGTFKWAIGFGYCTSATTVVANGLVYDNGYVYILGTFSGTATFNPTSLTSNGLSDVFVLKVDTTTGSTIWVQKYGGTAADQGHAICVDNSGNPYISGLFTTSITLGSSTFPSGGSNDIYVAKLSPSDGSVVWANAGGSAGIDGGASNGGIAYNPAYDKIVFASIYNGATATFGIYTATNAGSNDVAIVEMNPANGAFTNLIGIGTANNEFVTSACYDPATTDVFFGGSYELALFLPGVGAMATSTTSTSSIWLARYSINTHNFIFGVSNVVNTSAGTGLNNSIRSISTNGYGSIFTSGTFASGITIGGTPYTATSSTELLMARYNANTGAFENATVVTGAGGSDVPFGIAVNNYGDVMVAGQTPSTLAFPGLSSTSTIGGNDIFIAYQHAPAVTTAVPSSVAVSSVTLGGNVVNDGSVSITERGVVYSTATYPTVVSTKVAIGSGTGAYSQSITGLSTNTTYYLHPYIINATATYYGAQDTFTTTGITLPVRLISFKAYKSGNNIVTEWTTTDEVNFEKFELEKSSDARVFSKIADVQARRNASNQYNWLDIHPFEKDNFYRLKMVDQDGGYTYSAVVNVIGKNQKPSVTLSSLTGSAKTFTLQATNITAGNYSLELYTANGMLIHRQQLAHDGSASPATIKFSSTLSSGSYILLMKGEKQVFSNKLVLH
jgi:hypothetical protein